jgi:hypothetical protein
MAKKNQVKTKPLVRRLKVVRRVTFKKPPNFNSSIKTPETNTIYLESF